MKKIAINVVILPPDPVRDLALEWNHMLCKAQPTNIALGKFQYLPHISLVMGCILAEQLDHANRVLQSIATRHRALELQVPNIRPFSTASGNKVITFDIMLSPQLAALHETIVNEFRPLLTQDADDDAINDSPPISSDALEWINHYIPDQCFDRFWPHITVGFGDPPVTFQPISFQGSRLAICHLGNYCTCRTILSETALMPLND
jgi:hypothetical protein